MNSNLIYGGVSPPEKLTDFVNFDPFWGQKLGFSSKNRGFTPGIWRKKNRKNDPTFWKLWASTGPPEGQKARVLSCFSQKGGFFSKIWGRPLKTPQKFYMVFRPSFGGPGSGGGSGGVIFGGGPKKGGPKSQKTPNKDPHASQGNSKKNMKFPLITTMCHWALSRKFGKKN